MKNTNKTINFGLEFIESNQDHKLKQPEECKCCKVVFWWCLGLTILWIIIFISVK